jgi:hypothetical protein
MALVFGLVRREWRPPAEAIAAEPLILAEVLPLAITEVSSPAGRRKVLGAAAPPVRISRRFVPTAFPDPSRAGIPW